MTTDELHTLKAKVRQRADSLIADLDVGAPMTIKIDRKRKFTGRVESAKVDHIRVRGANVEAVFAVTLSVKRTRERPLLRTFLVRRIPTTR